MATSNAAIHRIADTSENIRATMSDPQIAISTNTDASRNIAPGTLIHRLGQSFYTNAVSTKIDASTGVATPQPVTFGAITASEVGISTITEIALSAALSKLSGIEEGAQVNVKSDWDATSGSDSEVLNKPDMVGVFSTAQELQDLHDNGYTTFVQRGGVSNIDDTMYEGAVTGEVTLNGSAPGGSIVDYQFIGNFQFEDFIIKYNNLGDYPRRVVFTGRILFDGFFNIELRGAQSEINHIRGDNKDTAIFGNSSSDFLSLNYVSTLTFNCTTLQRLGTYDNISDNSSVDPKNYGGYPFAVGVAELPTMDESYTPTGRLGIVRDGDLFSKADKSALDLKADLSYVEQYNYIQDQKIEVNSDAISSLATARMTLVNTNVDQELVGHTTPATALVWDFTTTVPSDDTAILDSDDTLNTVILKDGQREYVTSANIVVTNTASQTSYFSIQAFASADDSPMGTPKVVDVPKNAIGLERSISDVIETGIDDFSYYYKFWSVNDSNFITINGATANMRSGTGAVISSATFNDVLTNDPLAILDNITAADYGMRFTKNGVGVLAILGSGKTKILDLEVATTIGNHATHVTSDSVTSNIETLNIGSPVNKDANVNIGSATVAPESYSIIDSNPSGGYSGSYVEDTVTGSLFPAEPAYKSWIISGTNRRLRPIASYNGGSVYAYALTDEITPSQFSVVHQQQDGSYYQDIVDKDNITLHNYSGTVAFNQYDAGVTYIPAQVGASLKSEGICEYDPSVDEASILAGENNLVDVKSVRSNSDISTTFTDYVVGVTAGADKVVYYKATRRVEAILRFTVTTPTAQLFVVRSGYRPINTPLSSVIDASTGAVVRGCFVAPDGAGGVLGGDLAVGEYRAWFSYNV